MRFREKFYCTVTAVFSLLMVVESPAHRVPTVEATAWRRLPAIQLDSPGLLGVRGKLFAYGYSEACDWPCVGSPRVFQFDAGRWQERPIPGRAEWIYNADSDGGVVYLATRLGVLRSDSEGEDWVWSYQWRWDPTLAVSFNGGYGWSAVVNYGSLSGVLKYEPEVGWIRANGDLPRSAASTYHVLADPIDPKNVAYIENVEGSFRTLDGGERWQKIQQKVTFASSINKDVVVANRSHFSMDRGLTWRVSGVITDSFAAHPREVGVYFAASHGVLVGRFGGTWQPVWGLDTRVKQVVIIDDDLMALAHDGSIYTIAIGAGIAE